MMKRYAVMGNPIAHSLSPFIHQRFAEQTGIALNYEKILVPESDFEQQVGEFFAGGGKGLNITLPFKQKAFELAEGLTARCKAAKAANTLWFAEGMLQADNTDGIGLIRDLSNYGELAGKQLLVLGAGGAARGILGPLFAAEPAGLTLVNRNEERARALQTDFPQLKVYPLAELKTAYDLIINATSASLTADSLELPQSLLKSTTFCYDLAYAKAEPTPFVQWAKEQGLQAADGLGMLVEQAAEAFYIWHGVRPDSQSVLRELRPRP